MIGKRGYKNHYWRKRIVSTVLSFILATTSVSTLGSISNFADAVSEPTINAEDYHLMDNCQDGTILHCFDWKYTDIIEELPNIAEAGFTSIQTSPAQPGGNHDPEAVSGTWWWLYQPLSFSIGTNYLGTKAELTQLCTEAHKYGIKVIVDIVANHLAGDHTYIQDDLKADEYWHAVEDWDKVTDKRHKTTHKDLGMPDIASENSYVQTCVSKYIQVLKSVGVDGLRWDTLKHIQVPSEDCAFFTNVLDPDMYNYGESLGDPGGNDETQNRNLMKEYTGLMSVTDDVYGRELRNAFNEGRVPSSTGNWIYRGVAANTLVYWGESHDTWSNGKDYGYSNEMSQNVIDRAYAVAASRAGSTCLYFSRPSETVKDLILAGVKGSTHFTSPEVAAVNHFHNAFSGRSEYLSTWGNTVCVERGTRGIVLVNAVGAEAYVSVPVYRMENGTYTDQVSGNEFTVSNGSISGVIGSTGIAVVYDPDNIGDPPAAIDKLYLQPNDNWNSAGARFAMYLYNATSNLWVNMSELIDGVYSASIPTGDWNGLIFVRMKPNSENNWDNKWNQTNDLTIPTDGTDLYEMTSPTDWSGNIAQWSKYTPCAHEYDSPQWTWNGTSQATASFICSKCGNSVHKTAEITSVVNQSSVVFTASVTFNNNTYTDTKTVARNGKIYLRINSNWGRDDARFAACFNPGDTESWIDLTETNYDGVYSGDIPAGSWSNVIFCRMNPAKTANNWNNKWNQTNSQTIPTNGNNCFTIESGVWDSSNGTWSLFEDTPITYYNIPAKAADCTTSGNIEYYLGSNGKYYILSGGNYTKVDYSEVIIPALGHTYSEPTWQWADDHSSATAKFTCSVCHEETTLSGTVTSSVVGGFDTYTAKVTLNGVEYSDTKTVYDVSEAFLSKCYAYQRLSSDSAKELYRMLLSFARSVVAGEQTSSVFRYTPDFKTTWTSAELGVENDSDCSATFAAVRAKISELFPYNNGTDFSSAMNALLADCPYEFFWFEKTKQYSYGTNLIDLNASGYSGSWTVTLSAQPEFNVTMQVSQRYQGDDTTSFDTTVIGEVRDSVPAAAQAIVDQYANYSDYQKLKKYAEIICEYTDYNYPASELTTEQRQNDYDLDPWQLVYIFDNDADTKVVCEGYSKAFRYLCSLTDFESPLVKCYLVTGTLSQGNGDGGGHMWNVVTMEDGKNYLVDVTNSDSRTPTAFLLNGGTLNSGWYTITNRSNSNDRLYFPYDDETNALWGSDILTLSAANYNEQTPVTVTWKNYNGDVLATDTVEYGSVPEYTGATPTKPSDSSYSYTFSGWDPTPAHVIADTTYTATFDKGIKLYYDNSSTNWSKVYAYVFDGDRPTPEWPGEKMVYNSGTGLYEYIVTGETAGAVRVIFNNGANGSGNQYPVSGSEIKLNINGQPHKLSSDKKWNVYPPISIADAEVTLGKTTFSYDGSEKTVSVTTVTLGGKTLTAGTDYTVTGNTATGIGNYTLTITGTGDYSGELERAWNINGTPCTVTITETHCKVTVRKVNTDNSIGVIVNNGDTVEYGTKLVYEVTADYGYYINAGSSHETAEVNVTGDTSINGVAYAKNYKLSTSYDSERGNAPVISGSSDTAPYNEYITVTAGEPLSGYEFAGWTYLDRKLISTEREIRVQMTSNISIRANYRKTSGMVMFKSNGQLYKEYVGTAFTSGDFPTAPAAGLGYKFDGWDKTAEEINAEIATGCVEVNAKFVLAPKEEFTVTVIKNGATAETLNYTSSTLVTRTAENVDGKIFAYWKLDGALFTFNPTISIMAVGSCIIEAVYTDASAAADTSAEISKVGYDVSGRTLLIKSAVSVPDNLSVVSAGIEYSSSQDMSNAASLSDSVTSNDAELSWTMSGISPGTELYVRAFVVYSDANHAQHQQTGDVMKITAGEDYDSSEKGTAMIMSKGYDSETQKASFNAYLTVPENAVISKAGIVASISGKFDPTADVLTIENAKYVRSAVSAEGKSAPVNYTWSLRGVPAGMTLYARAYLVYTLDGTLHTVYGSLEQLTIA